MFLINSALLPCWSAKCKLYCNNLWKNMQIRFPFNKISSTDLLWQNQNSNQFSCGFKYKGIILLRRMCRTKRYGATNVESVMVQQYIKFTDFHSTQFIYFYLFNFPSDGKKQSLKMSHSNTIPPFKTTKRAFQW